MEELKKGLELFLELVNRKIFKEVSAMTPLSGLVAFGIFAPLIGWYAALFPAAAAFGLIGLAEVIHEKRQPDLKRRLEEFTSSRQKAEGEAYWEWLHSFEPRALFQPKVFSEFLLYGVKYRTLGAEQAPIPVAVIGPLCPLCDSRLPPEGHIRFPGILRVKYCCTCGFHKVLSYTPKELYEKARVIGCLPV